MRFVIYSLFKRLHSASTKGDENRPRLLNQKPGASDYINAVYINVSF